MLLPDVLVVSQAFCSALPTAYGQVPAVHWEAFAALVLGAAYEATPLAAVENALRGGSNVVALTRLGGEPRAPDRQSAAEASR